MISVSTDDTSCQDNAQCTEIMACILLTRSQSAGLRVKAVHGMCFSTRPFHRMVVIGPKSSSAELMKRLIGYKDVSADTTDEVDVCVLVLTCRRW